MILKRLSRLAIVCALLCVCLLKTQSSSAAEAEGQDSHSLLKTMTPIVSGIQQKYSEMLGVLPQAITNINLYSFIDKWYGTKYLWGGTSENGIDCSAFVQKIYENVFNTLILRTSKLQSVMCGALTRNTDKLKEGDLIFFKTRGNFISHVGIYLQNNHFVHSCSSAGVTISTLDNAYWSKVFAGAGQILHS